MATEDIQVLHDRAQAAAAAARQAADAAQAYVDQIATAAAQMAVQHSGAAQTFLVMGITVFVLAIFVGYYVVWHVTPALHSPLMSVTNAISSVIVVGALLSVGVEAARIGDDGPLWARIFGFIALILASVNIFGGFLVTQRMLGMYKKKG
jgi:NAD(P) transhydrogenase subunit alpha